MAEAGTAYGPAEPRESNRLEAFSDGVLGKEWPSYFSFVTSFATILIMWINHHEIVPAGRTGEHVAPVFQRPVAAVRDGGPLSHRVGWRLPDHLHGHDSLCGVCRPVFSHQPCLQLFVVVDPTTGRCAQTGRSAEIGSHHLS